MADKPRTLFKGAGGSVPQAQADLPTDQGSAWAILRAASALTSGSNVSRRDVSSHRLWDEKMRISVNIGTVM